MTAIDPEYGSFERRYFARVPKWFLPMAVFGITIGAFATFGFEIKDLKSEIKVLTEDVANLTYERDCLEDENFELKEIIAFTETVIPNDLNIEYVTRGVRNHNPMNVVAMSSKNPWRGQIGKDDQNHAVFETFEHGLRAGYLTLKRYYEKHGINTLIGITTKFCEGNAKSYARFIASQIGVEPDEQIDVLEYMPEIMKSMVRYENGFDIFPDTYFIPYYNR